MPFPDRLVYLAEIAEMQTLIKHLCLGACCRWRPLYENHGCTHGLVAMTSA